ncbi:DUF2637 domain-containing protein [Micromonospora sp. NPDC049900]|uniref:DUF2637 domain-containing protein n=1 Tax=Micromonospora sp. NPDC049900 TaxID=3364275 RepID=UPI0037B330A3
MPLKQLKAIRWAVRATLALGVIASTIANILHADPHPISQAIAAWPPLALLLTIELISRVPVHRRALAAIRLVTTAIIAGIAAWVSYWHMVAVVARYGETGAGPYLIPLTVDGLVIVASVCLVELGGRIQAASVTLPQATEAPSQSGRASGTACGGDQPTPVPVASTATPAASTRGEPTGSHEVATAKQEHRPGRIPQPTKPRRPASPKMPDASHGELGGGTREIKVPQTAEACARWVGCWISMRKDGLGTGPISLGFEDEARRRYGWGVKQIRDVRHAATSGRLREQASLLGVALPPEYVDEQGELMIAR